jgi:type II secretory pathway pseudopilin PulG
MKGGFSAVELTICIAILAVLVPLVWRFALAAEDRSALALANEETAAAMRTVSEELRLDARRGPPLPGEVAWAECDVRYRVDDGVLVREATGTCGGPRALARRVASVTRTSEGVEVVFSTVLRPDHARTTTLLVPLETP